MQRLFLLAFAIGTALALSACASTGLSLPTSLTASPADDDAAIMDKLKAFGDFTIKDLADAEVLAVSTNDELAIPCYPALSRFVTEFQGVAGTGTVSGAFSKFQRGRNVVRSVNDGVPNYLVLGCAPLAQDTRNFVLRLLARLGPA